MTESLARYREWLDTEALAALQAALERPLGSALRVNSLKIDSAEAAKLWTERYGWDLQTVPFCATGWQMAQYERGLSQTLEYKMGYYYIQDASSMLPAELFADDKADEPQLILDLAAAPGGKTTHLVSRFDDRAVVVANDSSLSRITALRSNLQTWGALGTYITNYAGERWGQWFPETFDKVLLDAPCSGDTLREEKGRKKRVVSEAEQSALSQRQLALLMSAFRALKPNGEIVYSTCTLAPEENEGVLSQLLAAYPDAALIERVEDMPASGLVTSDYHPSVQNGIRLWPHLYHTAGFFAARIRKTDTLSIEPEPYPLQSTADGVRLSKSQQKAITQGVLASYGFDFGAMLEAQKAVLYRREQLVYAVPELVFEIFDGLPHITAGLLVGQLIDNEFLPAHELITRFYPQFTAPRLTVDEQYIGQWLEGRDLRGRWGDFALGTLALLQDEGGRFLGRGKVQQDRLRNLLPKRVV